MRCLLSGNKSWPVIAALACCLLMPVSKAALPIANPAQFLNQTERFRTEDHPRFIRMLEQLHHEPLHLTASEQWHLRYLDAWETMFEGDYAKSQAQLRDIIDHSADTTLIAKASALLLSNLAANQRYEEAFALANRLTPSLTDIKDSGARLTLLINLSQMLDLAGQTDLAIQYALMAESATLPGESLCRPLSLQAAALYNGKRLIPASPELLKAINACVAAREPVITNAMRLILVSLYLDNDQPRRALALLDRISSSIEINHFQPQMLSSQVERAQAYAKLGDDNAAKKAALAALAMSHPNDISEWLMVAYQVLYQIEKKQGHSAAALSYYEHYVIQNKGYLNDISARALAYEMAQQKMLVQKLETEKLSRQNKILRLQQDLDNKAVETSRLYILLLLLVLISIAFWLLRLKRSQLRFKKLSCLDGLTGIYNHQHFISESERALRLLEKKLNAACLVFIDLDHFKQVNDTHGHAIGDAVLKRTVAICQRQLRSADLFGRLGGEEFGILLLNCHRDQGKAIADRIRLAIEASPLDADGCVIAFSVSVGMASTETSGYVLQHLCREADAALYKAKRTGRNRVITDTENSSMVGA